MLVLIGPEWLNSRDEQGRRRLDVPDDWVRLEIAQALMRDITVIPVCLGGANLPPKTDLPDDIQSLVDHQAISVSIPGFRHEMSGLVRDIRAIPSRKSWRNGGLLVSGLALLLILPAVILASVPRVREAVFAPRAAPTTASTASTNVWNSPPGEWVMFGVDKQPVTYYFKPNSLQFFVDKAAFTIRFPFKLSGASEQSSFQSSYEDDGTMIDCKNSTSTLYERTVYNKGNEIVFHYKKEEPGTLDLSSGTQIPPGSVLSIAAHIFCSDKLRSPIVNDPKTATLYASPLKVGASDLYYSPPKKKSDSVYSTLMVGRFYEDQLFSSEFPGQEVVGLPHSYRTIVQPVELNCAERKLETPKSEYFDKNQNIVSLVAPVPAPTIDAKEGSPLEALFGKVCNGNARNVAGKYEGMNHAIYNAGGEGDQKISISVEQTGDQLKVDFATSTGGQGEGTGILEGSAVKTIKLKSTTPSCPGSYEGSFEFDDDGIMKWSYKGQDCGGLMEGHGTAKKAKV